MGRPERGSLRLLALMGWLARHCGRRFGRALLLPIATWFWLRTPQARADSARYLGRVLGRPATARDTLRHYRVFASTILDRLFLLADRRDLFDVEVVGRELLFERLEKGRGVFMVGAHMGSFEALRVMARDRVPWGVSMAMYEDNARKIGTWLRTLDPKLPEMIVPLGRIDSMLQIQARLDRGDMVGFLADRSFGHDPVVMAPFLGKAAPFPTGIFRMAAVMRCPVIAMAGLYLGGNRYRLHFVPLADFSDTDRSDRRQAIHDAVLRFAATLETLCRSAPYNWFNFFDFWAPPGAASEPPPPPRASPAASAPPGADAASQMPAVDGGPVAGGKTLQDRAAGGHAAVRLIAVSAFVALATWQAGSIGATGGESRLPAATVEALAQPAPPAGNGSAATTDRAIDELFTALATPGERTARFHELRRIGELDMPVESVGTLVFEPPARLEKRTERPMQETLRLDEQSLSVTMGDTTRELPIDAVPAAAALAAALRGMLAGRRSDVEAAFSIALERRGGDWTMRLSPRESAVRQSLALIEIAGSGAQLNTIRIEQTNGDESQMRILPAQ